MTPVIKVHAHDLPKGLSFKDGVAVDTETMGLDLNRDRLCLVQISGGDGVCHLVKIDPSCSEAPHLQKLLEDPEVPKIFHFARFDVAALWHNLGIRTQNIFCTKIASKCVRTYTDRHGLKDLCRELLGIEISKQQQQSDWGAPSHSEAQLTYAATDVLYLHELKKKLEILLERENRFFLAQSCFDFIPIRAFMDVAGFPGWDILDY